VKDALSKPAYEAAAADLRVALLQAQKELAASGFSLVVLLGGMEGSGRGDFVNLLLTWLDARGVEVHALGDPTDEERERPFFWRFWRLLPPAGRTAVFLTSWYTDPILDRLFKRASRRRFEEQMGRVVQLERMLVEERVVLVKLWFQLSKREQAERFKALRKDPATRWRVTGRDWRLHKKYHRLRKISRLALAETGSAEAPWRVIEAADRRYREATAARTILSCLRRALARAPKASPRKPDAPKPKPGNAIRGLDLSLKLSPDAFKESLDLLQGRLGSLTRDLRRKGRSLILAFEGPDAAGKGGAIRRLSAAMDAKLYTVKSVAAPSDEEKAHPYLWRFWRELPRTGRVAVYDRTWYGRVLVERIEGFAAPGQWRRAFGEINAFEEQLRDFGVIVLKFWIAISRAEQLRRFKDRQTTPYKQYKLTEEDWRNREKWDAYEAAACEMLERTDAPGAPWVLVEGEDKRWARIKILKTIVKRLERELS